MISEEKKSEILGYIRRSIPDIARKCGTNQDTVINLLQEWIMNF